MEIKVLAFGIARDILGTQKTKLRVGEGCTIAELKKHLEAEYSDFTKLRSLKFAVNEDYVDDKRQLLAGDEVVLIPPVSGG